jgi:hypothetical protein
MKRFFVCIAAVLVTVCLPAPVLCESSFNIIETPESDSSDQGSSLRDNQCSGAQFVYADYGLKGDYKANDIYFFAFNLNWKL